MEAPSFPLTAGKYLVTGGREVTTVLTINSDGDNWKLDDNASLYDVTHLPCRSARYKPKSNDSSLHNANAKEFPVSPGGLMPEVKGFNK